MSTLIDPDGRLRSAFAGLADVALANKARHDRYEAALRKIADWQKYRAWEESPLTEHEQGANDAIDTLAAIAKEALS